MARDEFGELEKTQSGAGQSKVFGISLKYNGNTLIHFFILKGCLELLRRELEGSEKRKEEPPEEAAAVGLAGAGQEMGERQVDLKSILETEKFC